MGKYNSILSLVSLFCWCHAQNVMDIRGKLEIVDENRHNIMVTLNGDRYQTITRKDGSFVFYDIPSGVYLLDVLSNQYLFSQLKLKVSSETETVNVVEYKYPGAQRQPSTYPLILYPLVKQNYFMKKEGFSLYKAAMGNPMMVMMIVTGLAFVLFPNMLSVDKEQLKEMQNLQGGQEDPMEALKKLMGGGDSKADDDDEDD